MKYNSMCFLVDVTDDSMEPKLMKDDLVTVRSGFEADETHMAAVLVTDDVQKTTKLYIRKVIVEPERITLRALNLKYPDMVFEGAASENIRLIGIVIKLHRYLDSWRERPGKVVTARIACENRAALENQIGNIVCEPVKEMEE